MGNRVMCVTTPKTRVMQGDANTPQNICVTTTTPKGGWGGGDAASPVRREVVAQCTLSVPSPVPQDHHGGPTGRNGPQCGRQCGRGAVAVRGYAFALCGSARRFSRSTTLHVGNKCRIQLGKHDASTVARPGRERLSTRIESDAVIVLIVGLEDHLALSEAKLIDTANKHDVVIGFDRDLFGCKWRCRQHHACNQSYGSFHSSILPRFSVTFT